MINLLIVDDEPLVQAGIKSMIRWEELDIHIVGVASNGLTAYNMIRKNDVGIVITDIKMPVMGGLDLARKCCEEGLDLPVFIILTGYEDFHYVKEALSYQIVDYLVKLDLTPEILTQSVKRSIRRFSELQKLQSHQSFPPQNILKEQFFTRLIFNLFESEQQFEDQSQNLNIDFNYDAFAAGYMEISGHKLNTLTNEKQISLYVSSLQMVNELMNRFIPCHAVSLDNRHFCMIFSLKATSVPNFKETITKALNQVSPMIFNYYNIVIRSSIGSVVKRPMQLSVSYQEAKWIFPQAPDAQSILFYDDTPATVSPDDMLNFSLFKEDIRKAYAEFDDKKLYDIFTSIADLFEAQPFHYTQALDTACNILYLSLSLLNNGEQIISEIFAESCSGYRSIYEMTNTPQIIAYLKTLRDGLCAVFAEQNRNYKNHIVINAKKYIIQHIREKLTLNDVAEVFNISPNYLSVLFSKYSDVGFSDFVNQSKVEAAQKLMADGNYKVYEISDLLGFESSFYFSRVFKKITGLSPSDYMKTIL